METLILVYVKRYKEEYKNEVETNDWRGMFVMHP